MSAAQLQSVFHIEHPNDVPPYDLVEITHLGSTHSHHMVKRNVAANALPTSDKSSEHHVKKDLSKSAYYSELKNANHTTNSKEATSDESIPSTIAPPPLSDSDQISRSVDLSNLSEHNVSISAFGETYNLTLRPTKGLFKNGPQSLKMWMVHSDANATQGLQYDEVIDVSIFFLLIDLYLIVFYMNCE